VGWGWVGGGNSTCIGNGLWVDTTFEFSDNMHITYIHEYRSDSQAVAHVNTQRELI